MSIKVDKINNRVYINRKEYALITDFNDEELGHILKCCTLKYKNYAVFYLIEKDGKYTKITDENVFKKILERYETPATGIIVN